MKSVDLRYLFAYIFVSILISFILFIDFILYRMFEEKLLVGIASTCSLIAVITCLIVIPTIYREINDVHDEVIDSVNVFRVETDTAWADMMDVQVLVTPPSKPRENPFASVFRQKRQSYGGLPSWCQCTPPVAHCPPLVFYSSRYEEK